MASAVFFPTTDELCNLARGGAKTRNVQLDPRTKTAQMQQLKAASLTLCLSQECRQQHLLFASKACFVPSTHLVSDGKVRHSKFEGFVGVTNCISSSNFGACGGNFGVAAGQLYSLLN